ncbi:S9 family peptidase [Telmatobacter bradus]|uniref:S9 family peptidase n=1 Tax=Telmatobacter bradus TaxID=474953 RepID=UPI003B428F5F
MRKLLLLSALFASALTLATAQNTLQKRPMTFADMMAMKRLGETAVSPDGKWLAYSVTTVHLDQNKKDTEWWMQPVAGGAAKKITELRPGDSGLQFAASGKRVLFLSSRTGSSQVWLADFDAATGAVENADRLTLISTGADNAEWSPDLQSIVFTSAVYPDCKAITPEDSTGDKCNSDRDLDAATSKVKAQIFTHLLYRHWDHFTGEKRSHLFVAALGNSAVRDLTPNDPRDVPPFALGGGSSFAFSPDSKELAFTENLDEEPAISTSASIFTLDLTNPGAKPVKISTSKGGNFNPAYSPDGKYIAWRSQERPGYESDKFRLMVYDRAKGSGSASQQASESAVRDLLPKFENWVDEFAWAFSSKSIYFISGNHGEAGIYITGLNAGEPARISAKGEFSDLHPLPASPDPRIVAGFPGPILATRMTVDQPSEAILLQQSDVIEEAVNEQGFKTFRATLAPLTHLNDDLLTQLDLPKMQDYWFTAKDGTKLQGFVIPPPAFDPTKKYPVKFLIHGGPQGAWGDAWSYRWNAELFAANSYVVVMVNPRGSTGYGQKVVDGVNGDWGGKPFTDLMTGLDEAEKKFPFIDKTRECALGASYGGFMANWILGHSDRFKCIVSHDGMFNPESAYGSTEEMWFNEWEFKGHPWDYYGKPVDENPFEKWSPMRSAKNFKTPTLVIHSQLDYRLDVSEGYQLFDTLQRLKVPSKMLYFPDESHWVLKPQNSQLWYRTVNDWVDEWTK